MQLELRWFLRERVRRWRQTLLLLAILACSLGPSVALLRHVNDVLAPQLPYERADSLVFLTLSENDGVGAFWLPFRELFKWREANTVFEGVAAVQASTGTPGTTFDVQVDGYSQRLKGAKVSPELFDLVGVRAIRGRTFLKDERDAVVLSFEGWQRLFGRRDDVIGRPLALGDRVGTIVGVVPSLPSLIGAAREDLWISWVPGKDDMTGINQACCRIVGRLRPGLDLATANAQLAQSRGRRGQIVVTSFEQALVTDLRPAVYVLSLVIGLLVVLGLAVATYLRLTEVATRWPSLAAAGAIGMTRSRMVCMVGGEHATVILAGILVGLVAAPAALSLMRRAAPAVEGAGAAGVFGASDVVLLAAAVAALLALWTAISARGVWRLDFARLLRDGVTTVARSGRSRLTRIAVLGLSGATVGGVLLVSLLLARSAIGMTQARLGFDPAQVVVAEIRLWGEAYRNKANIAAFEDSLAARVRAIPGVSDVSLSAAMPTQSSGLVRIVDAPAINDRLPTHERRVDAAYFRVLNIAVVDGRTFEEDERRNVVVVSKSFERAILQGRRAVGETVTLDAPMTVIGVVADTASGPGERDLPVVYAPRTVSPSIVCWVAVRTAGAPADTSRAIREAVRSVDPAQPVERAGELEAIVSQSVTKTRRVAETAWVVAGIALLIAATAMYAAVRLVVSGMHREIGVRLALGGQPTRVWSQIVGAEFVAVMAGVGVGVGLGLFSRRVIGALLFGVRSTDTFGIVLVVVVLVAAVVALGSLPAWRVTRASPQNLLRES